MSTTNQSDHQSTSAGLPPVLAQLPWLDRRVAETAPQAVAIEAEPQFDASFFQPHQLLATADQPLASPNAAAQVVRFDPPQSAQSCSPAHTPAPTAAPNSSQKETTAPASHTVVRATEPRVGDGITQLRFDPPVGGRTEPAPAAELDDQLEPGGWHQTIAALDNGIRRYNRIIMLAALLTAAGLMMLVLESQQTKSAPASESVTPAAIDVEAMQPLDMAEVCTPPAAVPQSIHMARGPQSHSRDVPTSSPEPQDAPLPESEAPVEPQLASAQPDISILPEVEAPSEASDDGEYMSTGMPPFQLATPEAPVSSQNRLRLSMPTTNQIK